jgi:hypothetical protein
VGFSFIKPIAGLKSIKVDSLPIKKVFPAEKWMVFLWFFDNDFFAFYHQPE